MSIAPAPSLPDSETPTQELCRSTQTTTKPDYHLFNNPALQPTDHAFVSGAFITHEIITEPYNYVEAMSRVDAPIWELAMQSKIDQHCEIGTWELVDLPPGQVAVGCWWVYAMKTKPNGEFEKGKAWVVT